MWRIYTITFTKVDDGWPRVVFTQGHKTCECQSSMFCPIFLKRGSAGRSVSLPLNFVIPPPHLPNATWANWKVILYVNIQCWHCKQSIWKIQRICQSVRDAHRGIIMSKNHLLLPEQSPTSARLCVADNGHTKHQHHGFQKLII